MSMRQIIQDSGVFSVLRNKLCWLTVILPTTAAVFYFSIFASDIYISEARFVIRSPERPTTSPLGMLLKGTGFTRSEEDSYAVIDFMLSRDAMSEADKQLNLRKAFGKGDLLRRFPGLDWDGSFENMHLYYQKMVDVQIDPISSVAMLTVRAFDANEAQRINQTLLEMGEKLVNQLNDRGRMDMMKFANNEVAEAEKRAVRASLELARYRNLKGVIDPERQSEIPLQQVAKIQDELIATRVQILQIEKVAKDNPQLPILRSKAGLLEQEIQAQTRLVAGGGSNSLASKAAHYQSLALEKEFADKMLASALGSLEQIRQEAQRQQLYLERIAQPSLPDTGMEPHRVRNVVATFLLGLILWGILGLTFAAVREHVD